MKILTIKNPRLLVHTLFQSLVPACRLPSGGSSCPSGTHHTRLPSPRSPSHFCSGFLVWHVVCLNTLRWSLMRGSSSQKGVLGAVLLSRWGEGHLPRFLVCVPCNCFMSGAVSWDLGRLSAPLNLSGSMKFLRVFSQNVEIYVYFHVPQDFYIFWLPVFIFGDIKSLTFRSNLGETLFESANEMRVLWYLRR